MRLAVHALFATSAHVSEVSVRFRAGTIERVVRPEVSAMGNTAAPSWLLILVGVGAVLPVMAVMRRQQAKREPQTAAMNFWDRYRHNWRASRYSRLAWCGLGAFFVALGTVEALAYRHIGPVFAAITSPVFFAFAIMCFVRAWRAHPRPRCRGSG